jgi:cytochrome c-type biogenesis protein CcmH/NrfG
MTRRLPGFVLLFLSGLLCPIAFSSLSPSLAAQEAPGISGGRNRFSITGTVRDADTNQAAVDTLVELRDFNGPIVAQVYTTESGSFAFSNLQMNTYDILVDRDGFERVDQQITTTSNMNIAIELHRTRAAGAPGGGLVVSTRELSIPHKAHDAMEKGLALLYQKSDYRGSVDQFQKAIHEYPDYYEAYAQMGVADMKLSNSADAEQSLRKSIALSKDGYADAFYILATVLTDGKRYAESEPLARKAVELDANSWQAQLQLARALYGLNNLNEAQESGEEAAKLQPDHAETYLVLANIHGKMLDYQKLVEDLNNYLKLDPNGPQAAQARQTRDQIVQQARQNDPIEPTPADAANSDPDPLQPQK